MDKDKKKIKHMFSRIAQRYDLLNHLLSFGIDILWRKKTAKIMDFKGEVLLDVCGGTGDMARAFNNKTRKIICDFCHPLLQIAKNKLQHDPTFLLMEADAFDLPMRNNSVDGITIAFGLRNLYDIDRALTEFYRVLKNNGKLAILEFSLPENKFFRTLYVFYLRCITPFIGGIISGDFNAYCYLQKSIETFPRFEELVDIMGNNNYKETCYHLFTGGIATLYLGTKS